jgi:hypothetical protein
MTGLKRTGKPKKNPQTNAIMKLLAIVLFLGSVGRVPQPPDPPITNHEQLIKRIDEKYIGNDKLIAMGAGGPFKRAVVDWVTPEYRPIVIEYLKNKAEDPKYLERAQRVLIALGDEEATTSAMKQFDEGTLAQDSVLWQNLKANNIKYWVPEIYEGSDKLIELWPRFKQSKRRMATTYLLDTVWNSNIFPEDSMQWAGELHYNIQKIPEDAHIDWLFKQWWEHNKAAILAGRYSEATWIPLYKGKPDVFKEGIRDEPEYRNHTTATRNDILPIPRTANIGLPKASKSNIEQTDFQKNSSTSITYNKLSLYVGIGVLIAAFLGWLFVRRSKTRV